MRILITNNSMHYRYGTEAWTYALAKEFSKKHTVDIYTNHPGIMSTAIAEFCKVVTKIDSIYDLAIVNHTPCFNRVPKDIFRIFTSHSKVVDIEFFPPDADVNVAVSEEIAQGQCQVIRNGIDCDSFNPEVPINRKLKRILYLSSPNYGGAGRDIVKAACKDYEVISIVEHVTDIRKLIYEADLVLSFGRGALEAMACGRNVVSADYRPYYMDKFCGGGVVNYKSFDIMKQDNFTGRLLGQVEFTEETLRMEIEKYDYELGFWLRERILDEFNVVKTAQQYLDIYHDRQQ